MADLLEGQATRCWIRVGNNEIEVLPGKTLIGRHDTCQVVLDDALVSRRHALLVFDGARLSIEDLGSVNGVSVNDRRIRNSEPLRHGDRIVLGNQPMQVYLGDTGSRRPGRSRAGADTLARFPTTERGADEESTIVRDGEAFEGLASVVEKFLLQGRGSDAERILRKSLESLMAHVLAGEYPETATLELAADYAIRIAEATAKGVWVDYVVVLFHARTKLIPLVTVNELFRVVRKVNAVDLQALRRYLARMQEISGTFGPSEVFLLRRLEGLAELVALAPAR